MYAKLAVRNARRSAGDYLLYIVTMVVLSAIMMFSNLLAAASSQRGLQAGSVPLLISLVMVALLGYINGYMLRRRAREFATYILLGMKRGRMAGVFFGESLLLGAGSLAIGIAAGSLVYLLALSLLRTWFPLSGSLLSAGAAAARDTVLYFMAVQILSLLGCIRRVRKLQIGSLMTAGQRNRALKGRPRPLLWLAIFLACTMADLILVALITSGNEVLMLLGVNTVILSLVLGVWAFYKAVFHSLAWVRQYRRQALYRSNRLYVAAQLLSRTTYNTTLNTVLSICLLFSAMTFAVGVVMPNVPRELFSEEMGLWMSFVEICLCIVFIAIYFSILAVQQVVEARENRRAHRMMAYLGRTSGQQRRLVGLEIVLRYALPAVMCLILLPLMAGMLNGFLNTFLLTENLLVSAMGAFGVCFLLMYLGYAFVAYGMSVKNTAQAVNTP